MKFFKPQPQGDMGILLNLCKIENIALDGSLRSRGLVLNLTSAAVIRNTVFENPWMVFEKISVVK